MEQVDEPSRSTIANGAFPKAVLSQDQAWSKGSSLDPLSPELVPGPSAEVIPMPLFTFLKAGGALLDGGFTRTPAEPSRGTASLRSPWRGPGRIQREHLDIDRWNVKEVLEQEYVTRYIHDVLREFLWYPGLPGKFTLT
jgi:hypothetical protein